MGIELNALRFCLRERARGVDFNRTLTLGRLDLLLVADDLKDAFAEARTPLDNIEARRILAESDRYSDPLFRRLGATSVDSMDASGFEGATIVHDLNDPVPQHLRESYSVVFDGGTLEHVFNFPTAIRNCMEMVAVGGNLLLVTPCNNEMGHGFYQFSPDLFFCLLSEENGFRIREMIYCPALYSVESDWYLVKKPESLAKRVGHSGGDAAYLMIAAERIAGIPILKRWPQQSDYRINWSHHRTTERGINRLDFFTRNLTADGSRRRPSVWRRAVRLIVPSAVRHWAAAMRLGRAKLAAPDSEGFELIPRNSRMDYEPLQ